MRGNERVALTAEAEAAEKVEPLSTTACPQASSPTPLRQGNERVALAAEAHTVAMVGPRAVSTAVTGTPEKWRVPLC